MRTGELRLFVSSTFRDLMPEREQLIKKVFPRLRATCRERGIEFTEIDLRWGITEEEASSGKLMRICIEEIDKCRPYIIGIVGSRYGFTPGADAITQDPPLFEEHAWLGGHVISGKSITDVEFTHGMLNSRNTEHAFVYDQTQKGDVEEADKTSLADLLERVKNVGIPLRRFDSPEEFGEQVLRDMLGVIERDFPVRDKDSELARARESHEAFALNRRRSHVTDPQYRSAFHEFINSDSKPLVLWGKSGLGKSSLLASLIWSYREENPNAFIIEHYVGAGANASDASDVIRHIMLEIKERYHFTDQIPSESNQLREEFPLWLAKVTSEKLVLAIDALNQLTGLDGELHWLPDFIPANVRLIVSITPGEWLDALTKRGWQMIELSPLDESMRERITSEYLLRYRKVLSPEQLAAITKNERTSSPIFLRTLLEEIRIFGHYSHLSTQIEYYLAAEDESALFHSVLLRMEEDHGKELVQKVMTSIWASRFGLSETELLEITSLSRLDLSIFLKALDYHLMQRGGLYTFFHNYLREGIESRYLTGDERKKAAHQHLANYFSNDEYTPRRRDEEPYQWKAAGEVARLIDSVTTMEMLHLFISAVKEYELLGYWIGLDHNKMVMAYAKMYEAIKAQESPEIIARTAYEIGHFLQRASRPNDALLFLQKALTLSEELLGKESDTLGDILDGLTAVYADISQFDDAIRITERKLVTLDENDRSMDYQIGQCIMSLSTLAYQKGDLESAKSYCVKVLEMAKSDSSESLDLRAQSLGNLTAIYTALGDLESALKSNKESIKIHRKIHGSSHIETLRMQQNLVIVLFHTKQFVEAEEETQQLILQLEKLLGDSHLLLAAVLQGYATLLYYTERGVEAETYQERAIRIFETNLPKEHPRLIQSHLALGSMYVESHKFDLAENIFLEFIPKLEMVLGGNSETVLKYKKKADSIYKLRLTK